MDVLHLMVDFHTSHCVWCTLKKVLISPSNSHIIQLYRSFQNLRQGDALVTMYMQQAKLLFYKFTVVGWHISLKNFNLYMLRGFRGEFKNLVANLMTKVELLSYANLHNHLLTHEFLYKTSLQSMDTSSLIST